MSNSIWKTPDVKPDGKDTYIAITTDGLICDFVSPKMCDNSVDRWAYLTDIIAQADKAERLQKAVDIALFRLENILMDEEIRIRKRCQLATSYLEYDIERIKQLIKEE